MNLVTEITDPERIAFPQNRLDPQRRIWFTRNLGVARRGHVTTKGFGSKRNGHFQPLPRLNRNNSVGSGVFARSFCARASSFVAYRSLADMRTPHSSSCAKICFATTSFPIELIRLNLDRSCACWLNAAARLRHGRFRVSFRIRSERAQQCLAAR